MLGDKRVDLDGCLCGRRESTVDMLTCCAETTKGARVGREVLLVLTENESRDISVGGMGGSEP